MSTHNTSPYVGTLERDSTPLSESVTVIMQNWKAVMLVTALVLSVGLGFAFLVTPVYRANAMIQIEDPNGSSNGETRWANQNRSTSPFDASAAASAEAELVRSRL